MNRFPENLSRLRRRAGYTQESLAEAMGVSRQAVSKWESGLAMPEAATLVDLADLLGCTLDQLMRQELSDPPELAEGAPEAESEDDPAADQAAFQTYAAHMDRFALLMATGVALILLGVAALLMTYARMGESGLVVLPFFAFLIVAVFLFVWGGITHDDFQKAHPDVPLLWSEGELDAFRRKFRLGITLAVVGVLADVTLLVCLGWLGEGNEPAQARATALFMLLLAPCVWTFVYLGIQSEKMEGRAARMEEADKGPWPGVIMMTATIIYLLSGFVWDCWHPTWIVFPIGGILCGIVGKLQEK